MADKKISQLFNITGSDIANDDEFVVVDTSESETKAITASELRTAIGNGDFTVTGNLTVQGTTITVDSATAQNIVLGDNDKMTFGAGSDLQIYHDGAGGSSYITESGAGSLYIQGTNLRLQSATGEQFLTGDANNNVKLYYDNSERIATTSTGIDVTGTVTADGLTVDGEGLAYFDLGTYSSTAVNNAGLRIRSSAAAGSDNWSGITYQATSGDSTGTYWQQGITTNSGSYSSDLVIKSSTGSTSMKERMRIANNGDLSLFEDTGTTAKFFWDASAESLGIGTSSPSGAKLHISDNAAVSGVKISNTGTSGRSYLMQTTSASAGIGGGYFVITDDGAGADRFVIDSSGNVGIGTSSPLYKFHTQMPSDGSTGAAFRYIGGTNNPGLFLSVNESTRDVVLNASGSTSANLVFSTTSERMRIDSSGNVGIGTSSPSQALSVESSSVGVTRVSVTNTGNAAAGAGVQFITKNGATQVSNATIRTDNAGNFSIFTGTTGETERMRIDSSGNVGIGTSSPTEKLHVEGNLKVGPNGTVNEYQGIVVQNGKDSSAASTTSFIDFRNNLNTPDAHVFVRRETDGSAALIFGTTPAGSRSTDRRSERMRIDSSGNLLVGKTATDITVDGIEARNNGLFSATRDGSPVAYINRRTSDGDIAVFQKDGATVGSIGTSGRPYFANNAGDSIMIGDNGVLPRNSTGGSQSGVINLGGENDKWKDLYLSGGIEIENGTGNVGVGKQALNSNTASYNTAVGYRAGYSHTTGDGRNVFIGRDTGFATTGNRNTFVGDFAGSVLTTGTRNTILGRFDGNQGGLDIRTSSNNIVLSDGDGNPRMRIDSSGNFILNTTNMGTTFPGANNTETGFMLEKASDGISMFASRTSNIPFYLHRGSDGNAMYIGRSGAQVGSIAVTSSSTAYNTSSDYRLKENVVELTGATDRLKQLEPKRFNFIADADTTVDGFLAHEVQSVVPEAISGTHNEVDDDGNPVYQGIDQSKLVPLLVATIKELEARITALENA